MMLVAGKEAGRVKTRRLGGRLPVCVVSGNID